MPEQSTRPNDKLFEQQLDQLRARINTLPEEHRPHFFAMLDEAARQRREMEEACAEMREALTRLGSLQQKVQEEGTV